MGRRYDADRLRTVERALAWMEPYAMIVSRLSKEWKCKRLTVKRYIVEVHRALAEQAANTSPDERRDQHAMMLTDLYREARQSKHPRVAIQCLDQLAKLYGLTTAQVTSVVYSPHGAYTSPRAVAESLAKAHAKQLTTGDEDEDGDDN